MTPDEILKTEFSNDFVQKMKNRMATSFYKYGTVRDAMTKKGFDALGSAQQRIELYKKDGNAEWLVDAGNMLMMEFMFPQHEEGHFRATDSHESPGLKYK